MFDKEKNWNGYRAEERFLYQHLSHISKKNKISIVHFHVVLIVLILIMSIKMTLMLVRGGGFS